MMPRDNQSGTARNVTISEAALRGSRRAMENEPALLRSGNIEISDDSTLSVLTPLLEREQDHPIRILHVDDNPDLADVASVYLERFNEDFDVITETTVVEALELLRNEPIDCVISDYRMPNTNGLEFLEIVREQYPDLPFILFTGHGSEEIASEAIEAGVTDYMQKGGGADQYEVLANRVDNAVDRYHTRQQFWDALSWYQRLVEQEIVGVFVVQDDELVYVNRKFAHVFGYERNNLLGEPMTALVATDDQNVVEEMFEEDGDSFKQQFTGRCANGDSVSIEVHGGPVEYEGGAGYLGILRDSE